MIVMKEIENHFGKPIVPLDVEDVNELENLEK